MLTGNINVIWGSLIIEELIRLGVDQFVICPGSRSTPLVAAVANNPRARSIVHTDERGAAFFALGYAKATGRPAAVITTSGTAVANCLPAVVEAAQGNFPLLVLSADRPPELRNYGANQTITQPGIFREYVNWEFDLPCPTTEITARELLCRIDQMVRCAMTKPFGPAHLNCMFREPLTTDSDGKEYGPYLEPVNHWSHTKKPLMETMTADTLPSAKTYWALQSRFTQGSVAFVIGALKSSQDRDDLAYYLRKFNGVVFADIQAGLRLSSLRYVGHHDWLLAGDDVVEKLRPEMVVCIGERLVSKRLLSALSRWARAGTTIVRFGDYERAWDADHVVSVTCDCPPGYLPKLLEMLPRPESKELADQYEAAFIAMHETLLRELYSGDLTELAVAHALCTATPEQFDIFSASSMPIRLLEMVAIDLPTDTRVVANRGASGIDGTIASACGLAAGTGRPTVAFLGDQAFLHDLNSLYFMRESKQPIVLVLLNNGGGGIFEHLPIAQETELTERFFVAPHHLQFADAARLFSLPYACATDLAEFTQVLGQFMSSERSAILEVVVNRETSRAQLRGILNAATRLKLP